NVVLTRDAGKDFMRVLVERDAGADPAADSVAASGIRDRIKKEIMVSADVELVDYASLPRSERKSKRVYDQREG
ncbi:MAG: phenylacetate--CoA ligase family protein, partial [Thermoleophilia bacterium]|nr:phenylacetate--CoA ligase family protein [Thermoleophilia bacterium]